MNEDYINELNKNNGVILIDLLPYAAALPEPFATECFENPQPGLYLKGELKPRLFAHIPYIQKGLSGENEPVTDFNEALARGANIYQKNTGELALRLDNLQPKQYRNIFSLGPSVPAMAVKAGISVLLNFLNSLCAHTSVNDIPYKLNRLLKEEYHYLIKEDKFTGFFSEPLEKLSDFVGRDSWNLYFYKITGTCIIIQKGSDFRIIDWYRLKYPIVQEE